MVYVGYTSPRGADHTYKNKNKYKHKSKYPPPYLCSPGPICSYIYMIICRKVLQPVYTLIILKHLYDLYNLYNVYVLYNLYVVYNVYNLYNVYISNFNGGNE